MACPSPLKPVVLVQALRSEGMGSGTFTSPSPSVTCSRHRSLFPSRWCSLEEHTRKREKASQGDLLCDPGSASWRPVTVEGAGRAGRGGGRSRGGHMCMSVLSHSVVSNSLRPRGLEPARLLCPWASPAKSAGVGCHALFQGIFPSQGWNPGLLHCRRILYQRSPQESRDTCVPMADTC